jgi:hypothetical protein
MGYQTTSDPKRLPFLTEGALFVHLGRTDSSNTTLDAARACAGVAPLFMRPVRSSAEPEDVVAAVITERKAAANFIIAGEVRWKESQWKGGAGTWTEKYP